ncbi:ATP-binding cassette domain-containing protein, partial [Deinococcus depolymerans]
MTRPGQPSPTGPTPAPHPDGTPIIEAVGVEKHFGSFHALRGVNLRVQRGEVVVIIGPSGSGKSTFIRTLNALDPHDAGSITVDGIPLNGKGNLDAIRREVGMVFQSFNLFPHLTVLENITLAPTRVR